MKLISWNVNGIRAAVKNGLVEFLKKEKPDIIGLQEIKIDDVARAKVVFDFADYDEYWNPAQRRGYSGTATLVNSKLQITSYKQGIGVEEFDKEGRVQTLEFEKFYFVNAYFPNSNHELSRLDYKIRFNDAFLKYVKKLEKAKPVVICGDLNVAHKEIDLKNPKENVMNAGFTPEERVWMDKYIKAGFIDAFRHFYPDKIQYSWWSYRFNARLRNIGWRIDYFLVSAKIIKKVKKAVIMEKVGGSDHAPVGLVIEM